MQTVASSAVAKGMHESFRPLGQWGHQGLSVSPWQMFEEHIRQLEMFTSRLIECLFSPEPQASDSEASLPETS